MSGGDKVNNKMTVEMFETLKSHILRQKEKRKQEQEQDAAMERHRREQELKRKRDALSLEEIRDQLLHLEKRLKSLKDEKNELFLQLKKVLNEDEKRKKQRDAEILAAHQQAIQSAQQQQNQSLSAAQQQPQSILHPSFTGYPYVDPRSLMTAVRPTPSHPDSYLRLPVSTATPSSPSNVLSITGNGGQSLVTNKNTQVVKRRHEGSPSPTPPQRPQSSSSGNKTSNNMSSHSIPKTTSGYHFYYGAAGPTQVAYDSKGNPFVTVSLPDGGGTITSRDLNEYEARLRGLTGPAGLMPLQATGAPGSKSGGITSGFPVQRQHPPSSQARSSPSSHPKESSKSDSRPASGPQSNQPSSQQQQQYRYFNN